MYTKYYGFNEKPFTLTPNPRFIFLSKHHKEAFAHLLYGINNHYGFIELIGEVGTGKTTVLRTLLSQLQEESYHTALIFNPCLTGSELLRTINHEFGLAAKSDYANELLAELNRFLLFESTNGRTVVLVIDEAQNLKPEVLEQIRLISNLETDNDKLIQIILAGQPELEALLERPDLRQLNQRIAVRYRLKSMSMNETRDYISHRMDIAGHTGGVSFSRYAIKWIHLYTRGVPRMINILCDRSLLIGYGDERRRITSGIISRGIREILNLPQSGKKRFLFLATLFFVILIGLGFIFTGSKNDTNTKSSFSQLSILSPETSVKSIETISKTGSNTNENANNQSKLQREILSYNQQDFHINAFNALANSWNKHPIKILGVKLTVPDTFRKIASKRNLQISEYTGSLNSALNFNLPLLAVTNTSGELGNFVMAITHINENRATIAPTLFTKDSISLEELNPALTGRFYLIWQNRGQIPYAIKPGEARIEIRTLQKLLHSAGQYQERIDGVYSTATIKAVQDFQRSAGIKENPNLGELTLAILSRFDTIVAVPTLKDH